MLRILLFSLALFSQVIASAQIIANGGFENWTSAPYDQPQNYPYTSSRQSFFRCGTTASCAKTNSAYHGSYALQVTTSISPQDTCLGFCINTNPNGDPSQWTGGFPYTEMPTGFSGYFKSDIMPGDSAGILIIFRLAGNPIGMYTHKFAGTQSTYAPFSFTFSPALALPPDSVIIAIISSDVLDNIAFAGSTLTLDSLNFTGAASQPALMNGDFEQWQALTIEMADNWYANSREGTEIIKTTDRHSGNYAVELVSYQGDNNGVPKTNPGKIGTGYCSGDSTCVWVGGTPFTNTADTLAFWYKYAPMANDSASVDLTFKNNGNVIYSSGLRLPASASYQYVTFPFSLFQTPDSVIIELSSSSFGDTALVYIGSDLKVDDIHFTSTSVGIASLSPLNAENFVFPNPVKDILNVTHTGKERVIIYDLTGRMVRDELLAPQSTAFDISQMVPGIYVIEFQSEATSRWNRFVKE
jgi:hypothetical protein